MSAAHDHDDLHRLAGRVTEGRPERLRRPVAADPELAPALEAAASKQAARRRPSMTGIWDSGRGDLSERHDEIIRGRLKRPA